MKKSILSMLWLIFCFSNPALYAQVTYSGLGKDYTQRMDEILTNVNKTPITTGILYDRVMSFSDLDWLKENESITNSNYQHFIQSWSELYRASYNPVFPNLESLKSSINANTNANMVDLGVINTKINYIDYGTPNKPSLTASNGLLYNVNNINPFMEKQVTIISPLKESVQSSSITFRLQPSFILQLTGLPIKTLVANFGNDTSYTLISNSAITGTSPTIDFPTSGIKTFTFTATYTNNATETLTATMNVNVPTIAIPMGTATLFQLEEDFVGTAGIATTTNGNIPFKGYNETYATNGTLEYRTYYNKVTNNGSEKSKIKKEIIILDGYDPGDGRKIYPGSFGYTSEKSSLYELMAYDDKTISSSSINLVEKLRNAPYGFDVTLVNFPNGADYIERNAMALVALIKRENTKLAANGSTEQIVMMGPSMGGLVSRYALAYMEKNNIPHNTRLWASFDSPHLGANIPIAAQENLYFYGYKARKDQAKTKFDENFRSPAARQMLIEQLDYIQENPPYSTDLMPNGSVPNGGNNNTNFRQQFISNLNSNGSSGSSGFPQNLRKIAIINGTTNGAKTNYENQLFLELAAFKIVKYGQIFGTPIQTKIKVATIEDRFLGLPNATNQTFAGKAIYFSGWNNNFPYVINGTVTRTNINPRGSMDNVPGGIFDTQGIIKNEFDAALNSEIPGRKSIEWRNYVPNHAFIPTISSLAFKNPNFDWSTALNRNLVCDPNNKEIYFDSYFAPSKNESHVFLSADSVNWLLKELGDNNTPPQPQVPHFPIMVNSMQGPSSICVNANTTYTFGDICKVPSAATWSVSGNLEIVSQTGLGVTVKGTYNGVGVISAVFQNGQIVEKEIWVGAPVFKDFTFINNMGVSYCLAATDQLKMDLPTDKVVANFAGMTSLDIFNNNNWEWQRSNNLIILNSSTDKNTRTICPMGPGFSSIKVRAKNACGWSEWYEIPEFEITALPPGIFMKQSANTFTVFPNPSNDMVYIGLKDTTKKLEKETVITGEFFDILGFSKTKVNIVNNKASFSVKGLNKGIYILKIYINNQVESHQISVE